MDISVRPYTNEDSSLYGGQFDEARDSKEKLQRKIESEPTTILIAVLNQKNVGSISYIEDGRVAMLFRFAVQKIVEETEVSLALYNKAMSTLKTKGHEQVMLFTPSMDERLHKRYMNLGMNRGNDYTCYWKNV